MYDGTLTDADLARVHALRDEWMRVGLSKERCDRDAAEAAVRAAYAAAGLAEPGLMIWMDSPLGGALAKAVLGNQLRDQLWDQLRGQLRDQLWDQLRGQLGDQLRGQLWGQLGDQLWDQLRGQLRGQLGDQLWGQLRGQLWDQLRGRVRDQLRGQLGDQLRDQLRDQLWDQLGGQLGGQLRGQLGDQLWDQLRGQLGNQLRGQLRDQLDPMSDSYWLAYYTAAIPIAGLPANPRLEKLAAAVQATGWWWPMEGGVILCDRPTAIHRDPQGRLHHDTGPAMTFADGYAVHSWHGVTVPPDFWEWDTERALAEENAEVRRCGIEWIGWESVTDRMNLLAECDDPGNPGQSLRLYDPTPLVADLYDEPAHILVCANASLDKGGHRRMFGLPVPAHHTDPVAAAADLFGVPIAAYRGLERAS